MLCYLLDGYNIINKIEEFSGKQLSVKRELLIRFIIREKPQGSYKNKVVVVFDGNPEVGFSKYENLKEYNIEIIFSSFTKADEKIKQIIKNAKNPKNFVVVTDDKEIRHYVSYYKAKVMPVKEFLGKAKISKIKTQDDKSELSESELKKINEELKKKFRI